MKSIYEQLGGTYSRVGDYYLPNMDIGPAETPNSALQAKKEEPFSKEEAISRPETDTSWIGKYGMMRKSYLKEHRPVLYAELIRIGKLHEHLAEVNETCSRQVDLLTTQMARREDVTEVLKASDPMAWVARMNSVQNRAEEIVLREYVYA